MKHNKRLFGAIASFMGALSCLVGGTYAWFVVSNVAEASVSGNIVDIDNVEIGIRSIAPLISGTNGLSTTEAGLISGYHLEPDANDTQVFWANNGTKGARIGKFQAGVIEAVAKLNGYDHENLAPVTTGEFNGTSPIALKKGLDAVVGKAAGITAYKNALNGDYLKYSLVFKTPEPTTKIHLKSTGTGIVPSAQAITDGIDDEIKSAIRVGFEAASPAHRSIYKPGDTSLTETSTTDVAGKMDLNGDGAYDFYEIGDNKYEIVYGQFAGFSATDIAIDMSTDVELLGIEYNTTKVTSTLLVPNKVATNKNFLVAESLNDVYAPVAQPTYAKQEHHSLAYYLAGETTLVTTNANGIGELNVTLWVEGWDPGCINGISTNLFTLTLGFVAVLG